MRRTDRSIEPSRARRVTIALGWAALIGGGVLAVLGPLDALGGVLVLPPSYGSGLRLLLGALWAVGLVAMVAHAWKGD